MRLLFPVVDEQGVDPGDGQKDQQRALCSHPESKGSVQHGEVEITCKKRCTKSGAAPNEQQDPTQALDSVGKLGGQQAGRHGLHLLMNDVALVFTLVLHLIS